MKHYKKMNEKEFEQIKTLLKVGVTHGQIKKITNRSYDVIIKISKSENMAQYLELYKKQNVKKSTQEIEKTDMEVKTDARFEYRLLNRLDTIISLLNKINNFERR